MMSVKSLLCLGAGPSQIPVIKAAKKHGYSLIAIDRSASAPGFPHADVGIIVSTHDSQACLESVMEIQNSHEIVGILNRSSGPPVITTAILNDALDIPGVPVSSSKIAVHKHLLREKFAGLEKNSPRYIIFPDIDVKPLPFPFPVIVKPSLSIVGKSGISKANNNKELDRAVALAEKVSINSKVLVEEYIEGDDISVIGIIQDGQISILSLMDEMNHVSSHGDIVGRGFALPSKFSGTTIDDQIKSVSQIIISELGLIQTPFMASFRINESGTPIIIEIHLDLGGDMLIEQLYPHCLSIDFLEIAIQLSASEFIPPINMNVKAGALFYKEGLGLNRERPFTLIAANNRLELEKRIKEILT
jgi:carbamoylphosphate synthase large subunit